MWKKGAAALPAMRSSRRQHVLRMLVLLLVVCLLSPVWCYFLRLPISAAHDLFQFHSFRTALLVVATALACSHLYCLCRRRSRRAAANAVTHIVVLGVIAPLLLTLISIAEGGIRLNSSDVLGIIGLNYFFGILQLLFYSPHIVIPLAIATAAIGDVAERVLGIRSRHVSDHEDVDRGQIAE